MHSLLLVDADPLSLRVLDVSLRKAGFAVKTAPDAATARTQIAASKVDLVLFVGTREEERATAQELGAEFVARPVFVRELVARVRLLLVERAQRVVSDESASANAGASGTTRELALVDLLQGLEASRTTGVVHLLQDGEEASIYLRDGQIVDAELGRSRGADVVYRTLGWEEASFRVEPGPVDNLDLFECTTQALLLRAMDRLDGVSPAAPLAQVLPPAAEPLDASTHERSIPSTAPWTRENDSSEAAPPPEADLAAAGVPPARSRMARRAGFVAAAAGIALILFAGVHSMRSRQLREAELARGPSPVSIAATVGAGNAQTPPPALATEIPPLTATATEEAPVAPTPTDGIGAPPSADAVMTGVMPSASAAAPARDVRETLIDTHPDLHAQSPLVREAHRALLKGDAARAISLAQQAVASNPADADGWLTLAAARRDAGDLPGARDAYRRCIASAHTFGVMSCRALASKE